jgi:hypothetical protein
MQIKNKKIGIYLETNWEMYKRICWPRADNVQSFAAAVLLMRRRFWGWETCTSEVQGWIQTRLLLGIKRVVKELYWTWLYLTRHKWTGLNIFYSVRIASWHSAQTTDYCAWSRVTFRVVYVCIRWSEQCRHIRSYHRALSFIIC